MIQDEDFIAHDDDIEEVNDISTSEIQLEFVGHIKNVSKTNSYRSEQKLEIPPIIEIENPNDNIFKKNDSFHHEFNDEIKATIDYNEDDFILRKKYTTNRGNFYRNDDRNNHYTDNDTFESDDNTSKSNNSNNNTVICCIGSSNDMSDYNTKSTSPCSSPQFLSRTNSTELSSPLTNKCSIVKNSINENDKVCDTVNYVNNNRLDGLRDCDNNENESIDRICHKKFIKISVDDNFVNNDVKDADGTILGQFHLENENHINSSTDDSSDSHCGDNDEIYSQNVFIRCIPGNY